MSSNLKDFLSTVKKEIGKNNEDIIFDASKPIEFLKTGCLPFDLFVGGFPKNRLSEIFGAEHSGKSSLLLSTAAQIQKKKGLSVYIDFEHAFNLDFARTAFGLECDEKHFILFQPKNAEEGDNILDLITQKLDHVDAIFIDSIASIQSKSVIEASIENVEKIGKHANTVGRMVKKLLNIAATKHCAVVMVNQLRAALNLNPYAPKNGLGNMDSSDQTTTGGNAPKFYSSLRVFLKNSPMKEDAIDPVNGQPTRGLVVGNITKFKVIKSRVGVPFISFQSHFGFGMNGRKPGWDEQKDILFYLESFGLIQQRSVKFMYTGTSTEYDFTYSGKKEDALKEFQNSEKRMKDAKENLLAKFKSNRSNAIENLRMSNSDVDLTFADPEDIESAQDELRV